MKRGLCGTCRLREKFSRGLMSFGKDLHAPSFAAIQSGRRPRTPGQRQSGPRTSLGTAMSMQDDILNDRASVLLKLLVERYIDSGAPVASKQLALESELQVSSATVRNVMADLEAHGLVVSPHTSAGQGADAQGPARIRRLAHPCPSPRRRRTDESARVAVAGADVPRAGGDRVAPVVGDHTVGGRRPCRVPKSSPSVRSNFSPSPISASS